MIKYVVATLSILLGAVAQYFFKVGVEQLKLSEEPVVVSVLKNLSIWSGLCCYGVSLLLWFYVLSQMELSKAYPMVGLGYVFVALIGYYLLHDQMNAFRVVGIFLIVVGVLFVAKS